MDSSIDEKRVYGGDGETVPVYVVGEFGVAVVRTSDDLVGEFGLERRCTARDAAGGGGRVAVATDEDVLIADGADFEALGAGPAVAVGFSGEDLLVAREDGVVLRGDGGERTGGSRASSDSSDGDAWTELGELPDVRAIDGEFVAAESGVYRATDGLDDAGLADVRDVSAAGVPLAATGDGLYKLGNGWMAELDGAFRAVSAGGADWAHAAGESGLFVREAGGGERTGGSRASSDSSDGEWRETEVPAEEPVVALDHGEGAYAVTEDGTFLLSVGDGWRSQALGLRGVRAVAAP